MKTIQLVPVEFVHHALNKYGHFIEEALKYSQNDTNIEHFKVFLAQNTYHLMLFMEDNEVVAVCVFQYINTPNFRIFFIQALGGKTTKEHFEHLYNYAKLNGADRVRYSCRDSVARLSKIKHGFSKIYNTVERIL